MRLNAFSPPQYGSSFNAEYPPASTQREGGKQRLRIHKPSQADIQMGQEETRIQNLIKARGYFTDNRLSSLGEITAYNPLAGTFQVNGNSYKIPTTKNEFNQIKAALRKIEAESQAVIQGVERQLSVRV